MLRWLRRILAVVAILIALTVLVPLAYIEGTCRPSSGAAAASAPAVTLPAIDEPGYRRKLNNTFFTFPEWYIVYSFEDFGRFLDRSSESHFGYLGHIFGFWRSFCTINRAVPATGESLHRRQDDDLHHRRQLFRRIRHQGTLREHHRPRRSNGSGATKRTPQDEFGRAVLQDYAAFLYTIPWYKYPFREKLDGLMAISAPTPSTIAQLGARLRARRGIFRQDRLRLADPEGARRRQRQRAARHHVRGRDAAAGGAGEGAAHQADPRARRRNGSWCRRRATRT